jgi:serine/threonine protein phosphatase PrpC
MPQFVRGVIAEQTSILMCSDGFWRKLGGAEMISALKPSRCDSEVSMKKSLDGLVDRVKERGETDNISAILIDCII